MRDSTRIDAGQRKKTDVKLCREKMQNCEVVGECYSSEAAKALDQGEQLWVTIRKEIGVLYRLTEQ